MWLPNAPRRVSINEVSVRDGFQIEPEFVPTEEKIALIDQLSNTGLARIEITSFVSPKAIPNLRDAEAVARRIRRNPAVVYTALVPNVRGCERALDCALDEINLVMSASETHNLANMRMRCEQSLAQFAEVMQLARAGGLRASGCVATAFGCPFEGAIAPERVKWAAGRYLDLGMDSITLADTTGMADPRQVSALAESFLRWFPGVPLTLHFHNTRGMGLANVMAGLAAGVDSFDASLGGLGGCPFAPGATGNISTEDLVHMLEAAGIDTGVDLDRLLGAARGLPGLVGHDISGQVVKAGKSTDLHPVPEWVGAR
ncbi:hydroxymethylglutaryl-CoA lyase MvaB (plasmid) [Cupriavidus necator N-1]|uniref:Hydroxymethylglutaryl-CoA lyase MvaB n=1 Tax=Cupriavidus necator (strain ATCC 43291 / DSM 13513 / CCUG 52238 / LMG 8453 / N-1) TaxID=1042878 RepID=F8GYC7_CUPNN|nr:hydroxymethylglutaryl-CoA lyase [Cupriavidus necator]AEI82868.1 hydroxymethylglutaryl-CoA lyase MvaB [Cupriavidus necator N-1]MDX6008665.1 hydroxymethylglutaryl-CoA lyase [Cupriavidus necator]